MNGLEEAQMKGRDFAGSEHHSGFRAGDGNAQICKGLQKYLANCILLSGKSGETSLLSGDEGEAFSAEVPNIQGQDSLWT